MSEPAGAAEYPGNDVLTGIPLPLQLAAASGGVEPAGEADEAAVRAFIETLARVAHAVAVRIAQKEQEETGQ